jgi:CRP/FNR family cyclic AMP-dependent transcriptional regulator
MRSTNHSGSLDQFFDSKLSVKQLLKGLSPETVQTFESAKQTRSLPKNALIFAEGDKPEAVYLLREGRARLILDLGRKREQVVRIAEPKEVLGLSATIANEPYEVSIKTMTPCRVDFIDRQKFLSLLHEQPEVCFRVVQLLGQNVHVSCDLFRHYDKAPTASAKLARLLLSWSEEAEETTDGVRLKLPLTHENISRIIGTSRETVTRLFSQFKEQQIVRLEGSMLLIRQKAKLETLTQSGFHSLRLTHPSLISGHENHEM